MRHAPAAGTVAGLLAAGPLVAAAPAVTAIGPLRRRLAPRLSGSWPGERIALTFDDGPDPASTPAFLDLLARHGRRATFFVLGEQVLEEPALVRRMAEEGHEIAIHGWSHRCTLLVPPGVLHGRLADAREAVEGLTGSAVSWYRPPYGVLSADTLRVCRALGLTPVLWTAWGRDWERSATPERIVRSVLRTLRPGGTILLHDTDRHARGDWRHGHDATATLLAGPLRDAAVGTLTEACG